MMGFDKLYSVFLSNNRKVTLCPWVDIRTNIIKLEDLGGEHFPVFV